MTTHEVIQGIATQTMKEIDVHLRLISTPTETRDYALRLYGEVVRLQQREADLETALDLQEGLYKELALELTTTKLKRLETPDTGISLGFYHPLPSFLNQEPKDDNGEYARGVRA